MDDKMRFDQLEDIIAESLRKQDRTIADVGHLREAVAAQQLLLVQVQNDVNRLDASLDTTRREVATLAKVVNRGFQEFRIAYERNEKLLQETAVILARHELFHQEMRGFQQETQAAFVEVRQDISGLKQDVSGLKQDVSGLKQDVSGLKQDVSDLKQDVSGLKQDVSDLRQDVSGLKQDVSGIRTSLDKILNLLTKP